MVGFERDGGGHVLAPGSAVVRLQPREQNSVLRPDACCVVPEKVATAAFLIADR